MIITVTMNPAIDKTVEVDKFQPYALNRIRRIEYDAGGKGINVSKTIHALGGESLAMGSLRKYRQDNRKCIKCPEYPS